MPFCANCGSMTKGAARYCTHCGAPLIRPQEQDQDSANPWPHESWVAEPGLSEDPAPGPWFRDERDSGEQPSGSKPTAEQPSGSWPTAEQPSGSWPTAEQPSGSWPTAEQPSGSWPTAEQPRISPADTQQSGPWAAVGQQPGLWPLAEQPAETWRTTEENPKSWPETEQVPASWPTAEHSPAGQPTPPAGQGPLTLSEPVWVTDFFRNRPPETDAGTCRPASPPRRPPGWTGKVVALAAAIVLLGGGLLTWRLIGSHPGQAAAGQPSNGTGQTQPSAPATSPAAATPASSAPATGPHGRGRNTVAVAPALAHSPVAQQVAAFLQTYFRAINRRDYAAYAGLLAPSLRPTMREFEQGYRTTSDSGAVLTSLSGSPYGLAAGVTFISHQDPALSPDRSTCTKWGITLYLRQRGTSYLIVPPPHGYHAAHQPCL
jgi:hypothetical protein